MFATGSSQEIRKYFMFSTIFYWDYPPLHQSSAELVLCGPKHGNTQIHGWRDRFTGSLLHFYSILEEK